MDRTSDWNGFRRVYFTVAGNDAFLTEPTVRQSGNPWIWRASFPDFHTELDLALLRAGWRIGYIETGEMLGCDAALDLWDAFYDEVTQHRGLHPKPALEAVSRGGLYAYRYAARRPERIAAIYADTPVMDLKSWPGGKGTGKGAPDVWKIALQRYGFATEADALAYKQNPLDLLPVLAKVGMPLRHVVSLNDKIVPPEENTLEARRRWLKLGRTMELVTLPEGTKESDGHHFPLPAVPESVAFLRSYTYPTPNGKHFGGVLRGLKPFGTTATIGFLGGSITYGGGWRETIERWFTERFPRTKFTFVRAGVPSLGSVPHAFRLERDLLTQPLDLCFVEAAVNDPTNFTPPARMLRAMEGIVRHLRTTNPQTDIVHLHFAMPEHTAAYQAKKVPEAIRQHERVALHYGNPTINLAKEVAARIAAGEFSWEKDFVDLHPSAFGHQLYANAIISVLESAYAGARNPQPHPLPAPLDRFSYSKGKLLVPGSASTLSGFALDPRWQPSDGKGIRDGYVNVPMLIATTPGAQLAFSFEGSTMGLMIVAGPDTGKLEYTIDGKRYPLLDSYTPWSGGLHLPWALILADQLSAGRHTLQLTLSQEKNPNATGTALRIVNFMVS